MDGKDIWKMSWPEFKICVKCDKGDNLLVCNENDCLVAIHQECMGCPPTFDDIGRFQCPHCFHRQSVRELQQAWENAMIKKEALSFFEMIGSEKNLQDKRDGDKRLDQRKDGVNVITACSLDGKSKQGSDISVDLSVQSDEDGIHLGGSANLPRCDRDVLASSMPEEGRDGDKSNSVVENQQEHINTNESNDVRDPSFSPIQVFGNRELVFHEQKNSSVEEGNNQEDVSQCSRGSTGKDHSLSAQAGSKGRSERSSSVEMDSEATPMKSNHTKSSYKKVKRQKPERMNPPRRSRRKLEEADISTSVKHIVAGGKRRRLMWRQEEEEMLKEGVQKFSTTVKQNLPWRKILEFGRHVFDESRTPVDLKDKWRNMLAK